VFWFGIAASALTLAASTEPDLRNAYVTFVLLNPPAVVLLLTAHAPLPFEDLSFTMRCFAVAVMWWIILGFALRRRHARPWPRGSV
jgi:arginine exporter protein ArgO